jgi:hypothetical protein
MSSQLLIERPKESSGKSKIIKVAITANGSRVQEKGNLFDWGHEGKVLDITVEEEDYQIIRNYFNNIWIVDNVED